MEKLPGRLLKIREQLYTTNEYGVEHQSVDAELDQKDVDYLADKYEINTDVHRMCVNCQARQIIKYYGEKQKDAKTNRFNVRCNFVPKSLPITRDALSSIMATKDLDKERALLLLKSTQDPVSWASLMFGFRDDDENWNLRPYQKEQLRCTGLRIVMREGRRSGKTFAAALKLLYLAFNRTFDKGYDANGNKIIKGANIMIVTPYQAQIDNIFSEMEMILKRNPDLAKQVTTGTAGNLFVKTPFFRMEFENGAKIAGFVSGVGTKIDGSGGGTMRGQNADIIYLDEMDMIPDEVLDKVIIPILLTTPQVMLIGTSTPIGKRSKFYKWCKERLDFKEDHFPSTVLPQWEKIKAEVEEENSEEGFAAEYMALFIDGAHGVFKPSYVYNARQDYTYRDCERPSWWHQYAQVPETTELIKVMGIDWNKNAGTEFVVVAYNPRRHHWVVCESVNITASSFNSMRWKEEVVRLNYKWKPNYIYADEGYGHTIIEDLKLMAHSVAVKQHKTPQDHETAKLLERLVAFNFSQKVELASPIDGTPIVKTGKEFLVENAVRIFEGGYIWYPEADEVLRKQLMNYVVLRRSPTTHKPVYGPESEKVGDHRLDALMLALGGMAMEYSVYSKRQAVMSEPAFISKDILDERTKINAGGSALEALLALAADPDNYGNRHFRLTQDQFLKTVSDRHPGRQISRSRRGNINQGKDRGILEEMLGRASDYRGYESDTEHLHHAPSTATVVQRRGNQRRGFGRTRRRR